MKKSVSRTLAMALAACMAAGTLAACGSSGSSAVASSAAESTADSTAASTESGTPDYSNEDPINIRIYLSDNATLPCERIQPTRQIDKKAHRQMSAIEKSSVPRM